MTLPSPASRFSTIGWPADLRASFLRPSLSANQTKNATRKIIPAIGTLSGFRTMSAKLGSRQENRNRTPSTANRMPPTFGRYTDSTGRVRRRSHAGQLTGEEQDQEGHDREGEEARRRGQRVDGGLERFNHRVDVLKRGPRCHRPCGRARSARPSG